jgi:invasion protein IalB
MWDDAISGPKARPVRDRIALAGRSAVRGRGMMAVATIFVAMTAVGAAAQTPPAPKAVPKAAPKAQPKEAPPPAPAPSSSAVPTGAPEQLVYVPWRKFCQKGQEADAKQVCFIGGFGLDGTGAMAVMAMLIEPEGNGKKTLRVTLPLAMQLQLGVTAAVDQGQAINAPYLVCLANGCMADYEASGELITELKSGQGLVLSGVNFAGDEISYTLPLAGFASSYDGPPADPKAEAEAQKRLEEELQRRAAEARKKLEGQAPPPK